MEAAPLRLADDEPLKLRVFVDKSVVEVFANYPARPDSVGVRRQALRGDVVVNRIDAWRIEATNPF